jgi:peptidoglycan/LPS O-acetylase OafA/YrhL
VTHEFGARRSRVPSVAGLCAFAVLALIADQVGAASGRTSEQDVVAALVRRLDVGVAILFVVWGFLLYRPFAAAAAAQGPRPRTHRFWGRRLIRIVLPLWLTVAITFLVTQRSESTAEWLRHLALVQSMSFFYIHPALAHLWPVSVVVSFVVIVPLLGRLASWRPRPGAARRHALIVVVMSTSAYAFIAWQHIADVSRPVLQWLPAYLDWFGAGVLIAVARVQQGGEASRLSRTLTTWARARWTCWSTAAALWLLSATELGGSGEFVRSSIWQWTLQHALGGLAAFFVVLPSALDDDDRRTLDRRTPQRIAAISYGVFLWQLPVLLVVQDRFGFRPFGGHFAAELVLTVAGAVLCGSASWYFVDRPLSTITSRIARSADVMGH